MINYERLLKIYYKLGFFSSKESNIYDNRVSPLFPYDVIKKLKIPNYNLSDYMYLACGIFMFLFDV